MVPQEARDPTTAALDRLVVILNEPQDLVNIAGSVRAMRNMGIARLRLVHPAEFDAWRIAGIAHGSETLLEQVEFFETLEEAIRDTGYVVGTTARRREATYVWQQPREAAPEILELARTGPGVALVFGREDKGLSNEDLDLCDRLVTVPTDPAASSLNLAQAVLLVCYELRMAALAAQPTALPRGRRHAPRASVLQLQDLYGDVERALAEIDFFKKRNPAAIMRAVRAAARRAQLDAREAKLFRAMAIEVSKVIRRIMASADSADQEPQGDTGTGAAGKGKG